MIAVEFSIPIPYLRSVTGVRRVSSACSVICTTSQFRLVSRSFCYPSSTMWRLAFSGFLSCSNGLSLILYLRPLDWSLIVLKERRKKRVFTLRTVLLMIWKSRISDCLVFSQSGLGMYSWRRVWIIESIRYLGSLTAWRDIRVVWWIRKKVVKI